MGEITYDEMDPEVAVERRRILGRVDELWSRLVTAARGPAAAGTLAATDDALPNARFVGIHAAQGLTSALDHLLAWRLLVDGNRHPIQAQMTLLRGALEGSVRCRWLVDAGVDSAIRVGRGYAAKRDDYNERRRFEESTEGGRAPARPASGKSAAERLADLDAMQSVVPVPPVRFEDTTALMKTYGYERWFRLASAAAHGKEWALGAANLAPSPDATAPAGVVHGTVSASDDVVLALTRVTVRAVELALVDLEAYGSSPVGDP